MNFRPIRYRVFKRGQWWCVGREDIPPDYAPAFRDWSSAFDHAIYLARRVNS